jgi:arylformamidase
MSWQLLAPAELEREYSPSSKTGGRYQAFMDQYRARSLDARSTMRLLPDLRYGERAAHRLDFFPASVPHAPVVLFIHGGYWQELSKDDSAFAAPGIHSNGVAYCAVGYELAPHSAVRDIVEQCVNAISWLHRNSDRLQIDPTRIIVAGSSAGAHLAAMSALRLRTNPVTRDIVRGLVLLSGIYDLRPLVNTSVNDALHLDESTACEVSPQFFGLDDFPKSIVAWGAVETTEFKRQSRAFASALDSKVRLFSQFEVADRNHFDLPFDLGDRTTVLGEAVQALIDSTKGP